MEDVLSAARFYVCLVINLNYELGKGSENTRMDFELYFKLCCNVR